jgi:hypothetical protein
MGVWVVTKIVFLGCDKNEIFEKSPNGCQHGAERGSEDQKAQKEKMLSSVPCVTSLESFSGKMGGWKLKMQN